MASFVWWLADLVQPLFILVPALIALSGFLEFSPPGERLRFADTLRAVAVRNPANVHSGLIPINKANTDLVRRPGAQNELLVASLMKVDVAKQWYGYPNDMPHDGTAPEGGSWVTVVPELKHFCSRVPGSELAVRLRQFLGLPPPEAGAEYRIVEMWVDEENLFRPCLDPEIDDSVCEVGTSDGSKSAPGVEDYRHYLLELHQEKYDTAGGMPWTGLGYTYDWGGGDKIIGASEFILGPGLPYEAHAGYTLSAYCPP